MLILKTYILTFHLIVIGCILGSFVLVAIAAPIAIPAAVGALGFGNGGIVAGTAAATMMSWGAGKLYL